MRAVDGPGRLPIRGSVAHAILLQQVRLRAGGSHVEKPRPATTRWRLCAIDGPANVGSEPTRGGSPTAERRAQLLATEHWSLLATRSTTQSEVLSRITTFLMLVSASIVSLALIGQATRFDRRFITFALVLLGMVLMIGTLTQVRLGNAAFEDLGHVIGMNRLRAAYVKLDPGIEPYLVTSAHDDDPGSGRPTTTSWAPTRSGSRSRAARPSSCW